MSKKYTYSRTLMLTGDPETFTANEFDSFDEAKAAVDKGIRDRRLQIEAENKNKEPENLPGVIGGGSARLNPPPTPSLPIGNGPVGTPPGPATSGKQP